MTYSPTLGRWMEADPIGYIDGANLYLYERGNPINHLDPFGLATADTQPTTGPATQPVQEAQLFINSNDFVLTGTVTIKMYINIDHIPGSLPTNTGNPGQDFSNGMTNTRESLTTPSVSIVYQIESNYYKSSKMPFAKEEKYDVPKNADAEFSNFQNVNFSAGSQFVMNGPGGKPVSMFFNDYVEINFDGKIGTKLPCERIAGNASLTLNGDASINGVKGVQPPITVARPFSVGDENAKTKIQDISGSYKNSGTLIPGNYVIFKLDGGSYNYEFSIKGTTYKK